MFRSGVNLHAIPRFKLDLEVREQDIMGPYQSLGVLPISRDIGDPLNFHIEVIPAIFFHHHSYLHFTLLKILTLIELRFSQGFAVFDMPKPNFGWQRDKHSRIDDRNNDLCFLRLYNEIRWATIGGGLCQSDAIDYQEMLQHFGVMTFAHQDFLVFKVVDGVLEYLPLPNL